MQWQFSPLGWALFLASALTGWTADWPQYRGPNSDGSTSESIRTDWLTRPPKVLWRKSLGPGWSSISVAGGRAITQAKRTIGSESHEVVVAFDPATGHELWATEVDQAKYRQSLSGAAPDTLDGPRSTPSIVGNRVYVITSNLKVWCLDAATGGPLWSRDLVTESGAAIIPWSNGASPLVVGDLLFLNSSIANRTLTALHTGDGTTAWSGQSDANTHATPCLATVDGVPQVIFLTMRGLVGVSPESGTVLWRYTFTPSSTSTAATPLVSGDLVYASCAYAKGAWTTRLTQNQGSFTASQTLFQQGSQYMNHWASPVAHQDALYSIVERGPDRSLSCYDVTTRTLRWRVETVGSGNPGYASLIKAGDTLVVLTESGELVLVKPGAAYEELARFQALTQFCWNQPTVAGGRLLARSSSEIISLEVAAAATPLPGLQLTAEFTEARTALRLVLRPISGGSLEDAAGRLEVQGADDAGAPWKKVSVPLAPHAGNLEAIVPLSGQNQLFRVRETQEQP